MIPAPRISWSTDPLALRNLNIDHGRRDRLDDAGKSFHNLRRDTGSVAQHDCRRGECTCSRQERSKQTATAHDTKLCLHG